MASSHPFEPRCWARWPFLRARRGPITQGPGAEAAPRRGFCLRLRRRARLEAFMYGPPRFPHSLLPDSPGDKLLAAASVAELRFSRYSGDGACVEFKLTGELPIADGGAELLRQLACEFRRPL